MAEKGRIMYKLLIVDDEEWIRHGIASAIPWEDYQIRVTGMAADGTEAVECIKRDQPDVVVTDIVMTDMDGVELAGWIQEEELDIKVIILSGYDQFSYAREAMRKGAFDYLLKPVEENSLVETVLRALGELDRERDKTYQAESYAKSLPERKELFFMKLLDRKGDGIELNGNEQEYMDIPLSQDHDYVCAVWNFEDEDKDRLDMLSGMMRQAVLERLSGTACDTIVLQSHILLVCACSHPEKDMPQALLTLFQELDAIRFLAPRSGCCISNQYSGMAGLKRGMTETSSVVTNTLCLADGTRMLADAFLQEQKAYLAACREQIGALAASLDVEEREPSYRRARELPGEILAIAPRIGKAELGSVLFQMMAECAAACTGGGATIEMPVTEKNEAVSWVFRLEKAEDAAKGLCGFLDYLYDNLSHGDTNTRNHLIRESVAYLEQNFKRDLSAEEMAEHLHISKVYFSQLFSRETGSTFTKYLTNYRMEHAKRLLATTNDRVYEIAEECGYADVKYFLKVFKKATGMSPQAYRERIS